ncbi:hypothetical protein RND71_017845 [Anisodus tanguticus]|uniref:J domain-containing protein n=1 Tax=Anisodus tanguticus TaxID=243964 RepID=A0AAE1VIQ2_9SOLA|nr:hypothetical protein RND71_017845 [Anisodus tanguticus]
MECIKDEAVKAKEIAERKLTERDIAGAQRFALKAQNMFPGLDGLSQFLEVVNVYVAYEKKIHGEVDFYGVLSVDSSADDETIRKHYRKLALALHPDKNQSVGADGAFKMISEAWSLLSDRTKKMVYDNERAKRDAIRNMSMQGYQHVSMNPASARQAAHPRQPAGGNLKRAHAEAAMSALNQEALLKKKRHTAELKSKSQRKGSSRELSTSEIHNMLVKKAKMEISQKLKEWSAAAASRASYKEKKDVEKKKQTAPEVTHDPRRDKTVDDAVVESKRLPEQKKSPVHLEPGVKSMTVPDSDFHNFDKDRTEKSFEGNEVWAAYDDDDGMPRYYALIHNVVSKKPFKVEFSWLNSKNNSELGLMNWVGSGFLKTSGNFSIGKHKINKTLNSFSHKVKWVKGARGAIQIFPRKGDVWALYKHWSPKWNELTPNDVIQNYDMVEVLGDYSEKEGVTVAPLVKVAGFTSVFRQHSDPKYVHHVPREEMFRFSHQVPSYLLTGQEAPNAPTGCWELDPAALPLELLRVMTDAGIEAQGKAADTSVSERTCGESKKEEKSFVVGDRNVTKPIVTYSRRKKAEASTVEAKRETSSVAA